jgi:hypothetical protein
MDSKFHIVFPNGDRSRLSVVEIVPALEYELNDYAVASRKHFYSEREANEYARELAEKHSLTFEAEGYLD